MTKTQQLLAQISEQINALEIAWYIKEEVLASLKYLHWYKLQNIQKNLTLFCEYLKYLNLQNTDKISQLGTNTSKTPSEEKRELSYFLVPEKKLSKKSEQSFLQKIAANGYELLTLIQGVKGILVLSIDEFCNASQTRMGIHQLLMEREADYKKVTKKRKADS